MAQTGGTLIETSFQKESWDDRTIKLLGQDRVDNLRKSKVLVVGLGGVGGYAVEMLARGGVNHLTLIDADSVSVSNINRQLIALGSNIGELKSELWKRRVSEINPECEVDARAMFVEADSSIDDLLDEGFDYVLDCIDTIAPKVALLAACIRKGIKVISSMGAGGRIDVTKIGYYDLWETREDGLARAVRQRLKKMGLRRKLLTVSSMESPRLTSIVEINTQNKRTSYGTIAAIPATFGIYMANKVILDLTASL